MATSFQRRRLRITFQLVTGAFDKEGEPDTIVLEDFRSQVHIDAPGGWQYATARASIYGIGKDALDRLTFINYQSLDFQRNTMKIEATDDNGQFAVVFLGEVFQAIPDYNSMPNVPLVVEAFSGLIGKLAATNSKTYPGRQNVSAIMEELAKEMGYTFENNGVDTVVVDQVLLGSAFEKAYRLADIAGIQMWDSPEDRILAIAPAGKHRENIPVTEYSISRGLVGFPNRLHIGIMFQALFRVTTRHGAAIEMKSEVPGCNGKWYITSMSHILSSETPGGPWFSQIVAGPVDTFIRTR